MPGAQTHRERVGDGVLILTVPRHEMPTIEKTVYSGLEGDKGGTHRDQAGRKAEGK